MIIKDAPILDLREIPADGFGELDEVQNVKTVVLSTRNADAFMRIPRTDVRSHLILTSDEVLFTGQIEFDDDFLGRLQDDGQCVLLGQALIDGFSEALFFKKVHRLRIYGQVLYSHGPSAGALLSRTERLQGQLLAMPPHARRWIGTTHLDVDRLTGLAGQPVVSIGQIAIDPRVTTTDIVDNISSMTQIGEIAGREDLVCALLSRCRVRLGTYSLSQAQTKPAVHPALRVVDS